MNFFFNESNKKQNALGKKYNMFFFDWILIYLLVLIKSNDHFDILFVAVNPKTITDFQMCINIIQEISYLKELTNFVDQDKYIIYYEKANNLTEFLSVWIKRKLLEKFVDFSNLVFDPESKTHGYMIKSSLLEIFNVVNKKTLCFMFHLNYPRNYQYMSENEYYKLIKLFNGLNSAKKHKIQFFNFCMKDDYYLRNFNIYTANLTQGKAFYLRDINDFTCINSVICAISGFKIYKDYRQFIDKNKNTHPMFYNRYFLNSNEECKITEIKSICEIFHKFFIRYDTDIEFQETTNAIIVKMVLEYYTYGCYTLPISEKIVFLLLKLDKGLYSDKLHNKIKNIIIRNNINYKICFDATLETYQHLKSFQISNYDEQITSYYSFIPKVMSKNDFKRFEIYFDSFAVTNIQNIIKRITQKYYLSFVEKSEVAFPARLITYKKFQLICNSIYINYIPSTRILITIAILCFDGNEDNLKIDAINFINEYRGKWFNYNIDKYKSLNYVNFILKHAKYVLTKDEETFLKAVRVLKLLKLQKDCVLKLKIVFRDGIYKDFKSTCVECKQYRSISLMKNEKCFPCLKQEGILYLDDVLEYSFFKMCKECSLIYVIIENDSNEFNNNKCYNCDNYEEIIEKYKCSSCNCTFMHLNNEKCVLCILSKILHEKEITIENFIIENKAEYLGMKILDAEQFFSDEYLIDKLSKDQVLNMYFNFKNQKPEKKCMEILENQSNTFVYLADAWEQTICFIESDEKINCLICLNDFKKSELYSICSNKIKKCLFCAKCIITWLRPIYPGEKITSNQLLCVSCKNSYKHELILKFNYIVSIIIKKNTQNTFLEGKDYFVCYQCNKIEEENNRYAYISKEKFYCIFCVEEIGKKCPYCGVMTIMTEGKNHIVCKNILNNISGIEYICNCYWCFICRFSGTREKIKKHLIEKHNGYLSIKSNEHLNYDNFFTGDDDFDWGLDESIIDYTVS